jgi:hypothetical protein
MVGWALPALPKIAVRANPQKIDLKKPGSRSVNPAFLG